MEARLLRQREVNDVSLLTPGDGELLLRLGVVDDLQQGIGDRLARLAQDRQILAVTHSPQVAARAHQHLRVTKRAADETTVTEVDILPTGARREEIARMLSGSEITEEARAAADRLMARNTA